jgi:3-methyladenine DNA glycosylase AlkC
MKSDAIPPAILKRKGSPTTAGVPAAVRQLLDTGRIETVNLSEWLIVDQLRLAERVFTENDLSDALPELRRRLAALDRPTAPKRLEAVGRVLVEALPGARAFGRVHTALLAHASDIVRAWAAYMVGFHPGFSLAERLRRIRPMAADTNMSVREVAWFALREHIAADLSEALDQLTPFTQETDASLRRFASEATRPRGVWCRHIQALKENPAQGLPILEPLRSDASKYVRDSVGNWLNDASKSQPDWVRAVCSRWSRESDTDATAYIVRRALRTLRS